MQYDLRVTFRKCPAKTFSGVTTMTTSASSVSEPLYRYFGAIFYCVPSSFRPFNLQPGKFQIKE